MHKTLIPFILLLFSVACASKKEKKPLANESYSKEISFSKEGKSFKADLKLPKKFSSPLPTVVIIHEWWGRTERMNEIARKLTDEGYAALPVDLYGGGKTVSTPSEAQNLATPFYKNPLKGVDLLKSYLAELRKDPHVNPDKIVVIGYCFGGAQALNLARTGADVAGVVSFHGNLDSTLKARSDMPSLLILHGGSDPMVPPAQVKDFKDEMKKAGVKYEFISYPGATHAFTNPNATAIGKKFNIPIAYDVKADEKSWNEFMKFMEKIEKK